MLKRLWLTLAQAVTLLLAAWFILATLKPNWVYELGMYSATRSMATVEARYDGQLSPGSYHEAVRGSMAAVVNIFTSTNPNKTNARKDYAPSNDDPFFKYFFGEQMPESNTGPSLGSGVLINSEGIILTNHHVISDADEIDIAMADGRKTKAQVIGSDPDTDIAVLKIELSNLPPPITFGTIESVHVGDVVLAIGNPFGVGQTVTSGIVSALGRDHVGINTFENFIQTDAAINPGNSGGALIDTRGNLIGINTAIYSNNGASMGIGFAIPVNLAKQVMDSILVSGAVTRGWIGVEPRHISQELLASLKLPGGTEGVFISGVLEGGPAERGGIKPGDVLIQVNSKPISDVRQLLNQIAYLAPGDKAQIQVLRRAKVIDFNIQIGKRPQSKTSRSGK